MINSLDLYDNPTSMEPLFPDDDKRILENLALSLIEKASKISGILNPITRSAIANLLKPMNSYYSNLIEGHDTHPIDIERALNNNYDDNKAKRNLQLEAFAHIKVYESIAIEMANEQNKIVPTSTEFLKEIHERFYTHLHPEFKKVKSREGKIKTIVPGKLRTVEVEVGKHIAPKADKLILFTTRFEEFYSPKIAMNNSKIRRVISIAASHHRFAWIHPFLDGNGRVARLYSDAFFMYENLDASGLWSISRGLARTKDEYKSKLANADLKQFGNYDGRGNLSNKYLVEFCKYFLETAIDQIDFMYNLFDVQNIIKRIEAFADLMLVKNIFRAEAKQILVDVFVKGKISKKDAERITNTTEKTLKKITDPLIDNGLLRAKKEGIAVFYYAKYPIKYSPMLFTSLYPKDKEIDMAL